jgi:hypothetical protein
MSWAVAASRALVWDGTPYIPMGWRVGDSVETIKEAAATGVKDLLIDLPVGSDWKPQVTQAESLGMRYLLAVQDPAPRAPGFIVQPSAYRIDKVPRQAEYSIPIPNGRSVFFVLLSNPDFSIANKGWAEVSNGTARISVHETISGQGFLLLLYPRVESSDITDYWERFDKQRDLVLGRLRAANLGKGLRGIVNPLGRPAMWTSYEGGFVPDSVAFRMEFETYLRTKYKDTVAVERAWRMTAPDLKSFEVAARLVPLFNRNRGVDALLDPTNGTLISVDRSGCSYWRDLQTIIENDASRRTSRLSLAIRQIADVPVVYEWSGWSPVYDSREPSGVGIGMSAIGIGLDPIESNAAQAASTAISWGGMRWLLATEMRTSDGKPYTAEAPLRNAIADTMELGAKGWFIRWSGGSEAPWLRAMEGEIAADFSLAGRAPRAVFYPENARNPAMTMRLPGGVWWLPTPAAGDRLEVGPEYEAYRHSAGFGSFVAIWRLGSPAKVRLRFSLPERVLLTRHDGSPVDAKIVRDGIELTMDNLPILIRGTDEIPIPQDSIDLARADYLSMVSLAKKQAVDIGNFRFAFDDGVRSLDRNPGASFVKMTQALRDIEAKVAPFTWIEGESPSENAIGELLNSAACSGGKTLRIRTPLRPGPEGYSVTYRFKRNDDTECELWIAARIPDAARAFITCEVGGLTVQLPRDPESGFGDGYAWYRLGKVTMRKGVQSVTLRISPNSPIYDISIDALLITPLEFRPLGPRMPRL